MRAVRRLATITLALTFGLVGGAHAAAGDDARLVYVETPNVGTGTIATAAVPCATGEAALGGGIRPFNGGSMWMQESGPQAANGAVLATGERPGRWFSSLYNNSGQGRAFATYAVCSASSDATVQTTTLGVSASPDGAKQGTGTMSCPTGQRAIGGGILGAGRLEASGPVDETFQSSNTVTGDIPRGWFVSMVTDSAIPPTYRMYALCSSTSTATVAIDDETLQPGEVDNIGVGCPSTQRLLSGGVIGTIPRGEIVSSGAAQNNGLIYASQETNNAPTTGFGWRAQVFNIGPAADYKVAAVCEAPTPTTPTPPTNPTDPTNPTNPNNPPSNQILLGKLSRNKDRGTATLPITLPGPGTVSLESPKLKPQALSSATAGNVVVKFKSVGSARQKLKRKGKLNVSAAVTFTPTGGTANTVTTQTKLKRD